jgi:type I restriction enzyme, S subunit
MENNNIKNLSTYDNYKISKIIFDTNHPTHWKIKQVKNSVIKKITDGPHVTPKMTDKGIPFLSVNNIQDNKIVFNDKIRYVSEEDANEYRKKTDIKKNDILLVKQASIGKLAIVDTDKKISIWSPLVQFRVNNKFIPKYLKYFMESNYYQSCLNFISTESTQKNIGMKDIELIYNLCPSLPEQKAISLFLDKKTGLIDKKLEILKERKKLILELEKSVINQIVTKGLQSFDLDMNGEKIDFNNDKELNKADFDSYMNECGYKDSGVEWIGYISKKINLSRLKDFGYMYPGIVGKRGDDFSKEYKKGFKPFVPFTSIFNYSKILNQDKMQFVRNDKEKQNIVKKNDLLFLMSSEGYEDIGKSSIYKDNKEVFLNSFCKGYSFTNKNIEPNFVNYLINSFNYRTNYLAKNGKGFTRINLKMEYIKDMILITPLKFEQKAISLFLDKKTSQFKNQVSNIEKEIELLKEFRKTTINDVVTGKIKVIK